MAPPAYRFIDRRGQWNVSTNSLIRAATQTTDRENVTTLDRDFHRNVSESGRRILMDMARHLFWSFPALQASILEQANLSVTPFTQLHQGRNKAWGAEASDYLDEWHKVMDLAGWPYDYTSYCENLVVSSLVDGDSFTLPTEDGAGNPRIQVIPSHRIGTRSFTNQLAKVRIEGGLLYVDDVLIDQNRGGEASYEFEVSVISGVGVDSMMRPIFYRVYDSDSWSGTYRDIAARNFWPSFLPMVPGQLRGISALASSVFDWIDLRQWRQFEMLAQKAFSSKTIIETNETGEGDEAKYIVQSTATADTSGAKTASAVIKQEGGSYHFLRAGANTKLEAFNAGDRPGRGTESFLNTTVRDAFRGTEWDVFFSLDPAHVGGAPMRVIVDRVNRTIRKRQRLVKMSALRADVYALAKAIKRGDLPFDPDWYWWDYIGPERLTADRRYDAQTDQMEYELGWSTMEDIQSRRNGNWMEKRQQKEVEVMDLYERGKRVADKYGVPIQEAVARLEKLGTASLAMAGDAQQQDQPDPKEQQQ